ncbi:sensor domain-containing protein [Ideonella livida]|uniref:EAL domain-containing protein n=1 Tax=Ideonella livida TaxID=2707176 RepID=A0A7C9THK5_9BURK|nr:EAL domain-containing protein [Ideonella livida]NDY90478.1 EAL domain-containing protein [Ideonella livida]
MTRAENTPMPRRAMIEALAAHLQARPVDPAVTRALLERLQLYQAELEAQNEELRVTQQQLAETSAQQQQLFDALPAPALVVDTQDRVCQLNAAAQRWLGWTQTEGPVPLVQLLQRVHADTPAALWQAAHGEWSSEPGGPPTGLPVRLGPTGAGLPHTLMSLPLGSAFEVAPRRMLLFIDRSAELLQTWQARVNAALLALRQVEAAGPGPLLEQAGAALAALCEAPVWQIRPLPEVPGWPSRGSRLPASLSWVDLEAWLGSLAASAPSGGPLTVRQDLRRPPRPAPRAAGTSRHDACLLLLHLHGQEQGHPPLQLALLREDAPFRPTEVEAAQRLAAELSTLLERGQRLRALRRLSQAIGQTHEGIFIADAQGRLAYVNPGLEAMAGRPASVLLGAPWQALGLHGEQLPHLGLEVQALRAGEGQWSGEVWLQPASGPAIPVWLLLSAGPPGDGLGADVLGTVQDLRQRKADADRIHQLAFYDPLTGLPNRRLLQDRLRRALARQRRHGVQAVVFFIDLDDFKRVNDVLGHDQGDALLLHVALQIKSCLRTNDTVARLGGDEFVVLTELPAQEPARLPLAAEHIAQKLMRAVGQPVWLREQRVTVTPSIGITLLNEPSLTVEDVLKQADLAMYRAKRAGPGQLRFFSPAMQAEAEARARLEADLHEALALGELELVYQPQVDRAGRITGCEGLLRWRHPQRGLVMPADFIPVAEQSGCLPAMGRWVIEQACATLAQWRRMPARRHWTLAVNLSARQFHDTGLGAWVQACLLQHEVAPGRLELELTESTLVDDVELASARMRELRDLGVLLSLDDFGTGYSSLAYLQALPLHKLKLDQRFVRELPGASADAVIARTVIGLAHSLGLKALAEGVEQPAQLALLQEAGCDHFQGYLFGHPQPLTGLPDVGAAGALAAPPAPGLSC